MHAQAARPKPYLRNSRFLGKRRGGRTESGGDIERFAFGMGPKMVKGKGGLD